MLACDGQMALKEQLLEDARVIWHELGRFTTEAVCLDLLSADIAEERGDDEGATELRQRNRCYRCIAGTILTRHRNLLAQALQPFHGRNPFLGLAQQSARSWLPRVPNLGVRRAVKKCLKRSLTWTKMGGHPVAGVTLTPTDNVRPPARPVFVWAEARKVGKARGAQQSRRRLESKPDRKLDSRCESGLSAGPRPIVRGLPQLPVAPGEAGDRQPAAHQDRAVGF